MSERLRKGIVFGALFLAIIWGIYNFLPKSEQSPKDSGKTVSLETIPAVSQMAAVEKSIDVAEMKSKSWGNDPFRAIDKSTGYREIVEKPRWKLSGIVYNSVKPLAIINGKSVAVGDKLGNASIVEIRKTSVIVEHSGTRIMLKVTKS